MKGRTDLTFLSKLEPMLGQALAEGFGLHGLGVASNNRRYNLSAFLEKGFVKFISDKHPPVSLADIDEAFLFAFKAWLDDPSEDWHAKPEVYRKEILGALQLVLKQLQHCPTWSGQLSPKLKLISKAYSKAHRAIQHKECLKDHELERLYQAAVSEIEETITQIEAAWSRWELLRATPLSMREAGISADHCAIYLTQNYSHPVPSYYTLGRDSTKWPKFVSAETQEQAERLLYPDLGEILPLLLLMTTFFALNPSTAFFLKEGDYDFSQFAGRERLSIAPHKPRSRRRQRNAVTVTNDFANPGRVLRFLEKRVRSLWESSPDLHGRIFCRFSFEQRKSVAFSISDKSLREAIGRFCVRHGLTPFRLDQLRPTTLDLVDELMQGDIFAKKAVANHSSVQTSYGFYEGDAQRQRNRERVGDAQEQFERSIRTLAKADGRGRVRHHLDPGSATPGFFCLDPKSSPIPGEKLGELCGAYGMCPVCPLAQVDHASAHSYAYLLQLNEKIDGALYSNTTSFGSAAWRSRWGPVKQRLVTFWLPRFPARVVEQARTIPVPNLPPVE